MRNTNPWYLKKKGAPPQPTLLFTTAITSTTVTLGWTAFPNVTSYEIQRSSNGGSTWSTPIFTGNATSFTDTGRSTGTTYNYRHRQFYGTRASVYSEPLEVTTTGVSVPAVPGNPPTVTNVGETTVTIAIESIVNATSYEIQRSTTSGTSGFSNLPNQPQTGLTYADTGLTSGATYWYRYAARNGDGLSAGYSPSVGQTTAVPDTVPPNPTSTPVPSSITDTSVTITMPVIATADTYILQQSTTSITGPWTGVYNSGIGGSRTTTITSLNADTDYWYRYRTSNDVGVSALWSSGVLVHTEEDGGPNDGNVTPVSAFYFRKHAGSDSHPNDGAGSWDPDNAEEICASMAAAGFTFTRGMYSLIYTRMDTWVDALAANNMKWLMTLIPEAGSNSTVISGTTIEEVRNKIQTIRTRQTTAGNWHRDVCYGLEGANEPNHSKLKDANGNTIPVPTNWAQQTVNYQDAIWEESHNVLSNGNQNPLRGKIIVGPSLHDVRVEATNGGDWTKLLNAGLNVTPGHADQNADQIGLHTYPGGLFPTRGLDMPNQDGKLSRMKYIENVFGTEVPVFCTEWGYHNATTHTNYTSEQVSGIYGPRGYLQFITQCYGPGTGVSGTPPARDLHLAYYEHLDDPQPGNVSDAAFAANNEYHTGLLRTPTASPSSWSDKPIYTSISALLNDIRDPDTVTTDYTPERVLCNVVPVGVTLAASKLQWSVTATQAQSNNNTATLWIWQDVELWNKGSDTYTNPTAIDVDIEDFAGTRRFAIRGPVTKILLRAPT